MRDIKNVKLVSYLHICPSLSYSFSVTRNIKIRDDKLIVYIKFINDIIFFFFFFLILNTVRS